MEKDSNSKPTTPLHGSHNHHDDVIKVSIREKIIIIFCVQVR